MKHIFTKLAKPFLVVLFCFGIFLHISFLDWGSPFYFHPDERQNIAYPILASHSFLLWDQKNFDTGTFPLVVIKATTLFAHTAFPQYFSDSMESIILIARFFSSMLSLGIVALLFVLGRKIANSTCGFFAALLGLFSTGFIQFSHFGTIEVWEAFLFLLLFYFCITLSTRLTYTKSTILGSIFAFAFTTKVLSVFLFPVLLVPFVVHFFKKSRRIHTFKAFCLFLLTVLIATCVFLPQLFISFSIFYQSIHFESSVALGTLPVFYTQEFYSTIPIVFQTLHIFPFLLNPFLTVLLFPSIFVLSWIAVKKRNLTFIFLILFFSVLFFSQAYFFAKWTRYMIPSLPFIYLLIAITIDHFFHKKLAFFLMFFLSGVSIFFGFAYYMTVFLQSDTRLQALQWSQVHIPVDATILSEPYDLGLLPFQQYFPHIQTFDFYTLDRVNLSQLTTELANNNYIVLPSQRLIKTRLFLKQNFALGNKFYSRLLDTSLGFQKIYETSCSTICHIAYLGNPVYSFEETATVFDRPTLFIFKKIHPLTNIEYEELLN
ncbi:MAG TPA: glycosyltransferase family 39 protein [Patescibacteria group bacterium]|nr:glycosyltransferase family 39 protein [Patescibacteria group bacterium]